MKSVGEFKGDLAMEMSYHLTENCWIIVHAWNQQFEFKSTGNVIARLVRDGNTVTLSSGDGKHDSLSVKLREDNLEIATPISLHLDRRNLARSSMELLIHRIDIAARKKP